MPLDLLSNNPWQDGSDRRTRHLASAPAWVLGEPREPKRGEKPADLTLLAKTPKRSELRGSSDVCSDGRDG